MTMSRDPEKEAFWRMVVEEQVKSELPIRHFCRQEGLTESLFYAWRRELRYRDQEEAVNAIDGTTGVISAEPKEPSACQVYLVKINPSDLSETYKQLTMFLGGFNG